MSEQPRYKVATSTGYAIADTAGRSGARPGLTASVLDTWDAHREVKRFRSEELSRRDVLKELRNPETLRRAQRYADKLNAEAV